MVLIFYTLYVFKQDACNSMGGHLLEIRNKREENWIAQQPNKRGTVVNLLV